MFSVMRRPRVARIEQREMRGLRSRLSLALQPGCGYGEASWQNEPRKYNDFNEPLATALP